MSFKRKGERIDIELSSSIKDVDEVKRNFCIIRNISRNGVFVTAKIKYSIGQFVECIISFNDQSIMFRGKVRRAFDADEHGAFGYGIEITDIFEKDAKVLDEFILAGYLPEVE